MRVVQWATGNVGRRALRGIIEHPDLELVGVWTHSARKIGADAGKLAGTEPIGITATSDVDALLSLAPDCVLYAPTTLDDELVARMLRGGVNVVTTCDGYLTGTNFPEARRRTLVRAGLEGNATFLGTGFHPGYANLLAGFLARPCRSVRSVRLFEALDCAAYPVKAAWQATGFGRPLEERRSGPSDRHASPDVAGFFDALDLVAGLFGVTLERKEWTAERAAATQDIDLGWMRFPKGSIAGQRRSYSGFVNGHEIVTLSVTWTMSPVALDRDWGTDEGYRIIIDAEPRVEAAIGYGPAEVSESDEDGVMGSLLVATAMSATNVIPQVCAARPGVVTLAELPMGGARLQTEPVDA